MTKRNWPALQNTLDITISNCLAQPEGYSKRTKLDFPNGLEQLSVEDGINFDIQLSASNAKLFVCSSNGETSVFDGDFETFVAKIDEIVGQAIETAQTV